MPLISLSIKRFEKVIRIVRIKRPGQRGTWITDEVEMAYTAMHELGYAVSAETWRDGYL
jgi:leucyl/phenylalanyl-tRNA--protein transferase